MKRDQVAGAIAAWLSNTLSAADFSRPDRFLFLIRRPGRAGLLCLIPVASGKFSAAEDRAQRARLEAQGCRVIVVRSTVDAELAIGRRALADLVERRAAVARRRKALVEHLRSIPCAPRRRPDLAWLRRAA